MPRNPLKKFALRCYSDPIYQLGEIDRSGHISNSLDAIAAKAGCCRRAVVDALARLRDLGLIVWQRRCEETRDAEGRFRLRQRANAYGLLLPSPWLRYPQDAPPPPPPAAAGGPGAVSRPVEGPG